MSALKHYENTSVVPDEEVAKMNRLRNQFAQLQDATALNSLSGRQLAFARLAAIVTDVMFGPMMRCLLYVFDCHHTQTCDMVCRQLRRSTLQKTKALC